MELQTHSLLTTSIGEVIDQPDAAAVLPQGKEHLVFVQ